jgi:hypothetical protein
MSKAVHKLMTEVTTSHNDQHWLGIIAVARGEGRDRKGKQGWRGIWTSAYNSAAYEDTTHSHSRAVMNMGGLKKAIER